MHRTRESNKMTAKFYERPAIKTGHAAGSHKISTSSNKLGDPPHWRQTDGRSVYDFIYDQCSYHGA